MQVNSISAGQCKLAVFERFATPAPGLEFVPFAGNANPGHSNPCILVRRPWCYGCRAEALQPHDTGRALLQRPRHISSWKPILLKLVPRAMEAQETTCQRKMCPVHTEVKIAALDQLMSSRWVAV